MKSDCGGGGGRCAVIVTHEGRFVEDANRVVLVDGDRIMGEGGKFEECVEKSVGVNFWFVG